MTEIFKKYVFTDQLNLDPINKCHHFKISFNIDIAFIKLNKFNSLLSDVKTQIESKCLLFSLRIDRTNVDPECIIKYLHFQKRAKICYTITE